MFDGAGNAAPITARVVALPVLVMRTSGKAGFRSRTGLTGRRALMSESGSNGIVCVRSRYPFAETLQRLLAALSQHHVTVFATIDHQAAAKTVGIAMPRTTVVVFGNPAVGTPLMLARPSLALDLPSKALIAEAATGEVTVSCNAADYLVARHDLPADAMEKLQGFSGLLRAVLA